ncbi:Ribosomal silencing factor RsfS [Phycisphaerales bacterium]|nr:Ribosomal silencing factor RsfS [Phycisphaerales bacterium]
MPEPNKATRKASATKPKVMKPRKAAQPKVAKPKSAKPKAEAPDAAREFAIETARLLHDDKCTDVALLDVRGLSQVTNYIVIGSGTSDRQMRSALMHAELLGKQRGFSAWRSDADSGGVWLLLDLVEVVVHLFEPNTRAHYDLEMLWGDAPRVSWERPDQTSRDRARLKSS